MFDVIVVGGGPAGLSAALILGRCRRRVLVVDSGQYRNAVSQEMHGFLSRDCTDPAELRRIAREQLRRYDTVEVRSGKVTDALRTEAGFDVKFADGARLSCRKLLLATGVVDELPNLDGFTDIYGRSAFHCPYCDGWEWRDRRLAAYGEGAKAKALALELLGWSRDIVVLTDGDAGLPTEERDLLVRNGIQLDERRIARLDSEDGQLTAIRFTDGGVLERDALFFATPTEQGCAIAEDLGCNFTDRGSVATRSYEKTNVPGLYVAGDASRYVDLVIVAAAEGAMAAFAINTELLKEDRA
jgi:thioredoxin reductase